MVQNDVEIFASSNNAHDLILKRVFVRIHDCVLFWLGFITGRIQNFNAASDEKQNI